MTVAIPLAPVTGTRRRDGAASTRHALQNNAAHCVARCVQGLPARKTNTAFVPPNANEFDSIVRTDAPSRATLGT